MPSYPSFWHIPVSSNGMSLAVIAMISVSAARLPALLAVGAQPVTTMDSARPAAAVARRLPHLYRIDIPSSSRWRGYRGGGGRGYVVRVARPRVVEVAGDELPRLAREQQRPFAGAARHGVRATGAEHTA